MVEERFMRRAIDLAYRAEAQSVSPNPRVGAVLVHQGRVIGEGYHTQVGTEHAEVRCLSSVRPADQSLVSESTMYVTLEPCAHAGRTPSCAKRLVQEQVKRVVVGTVDPFPLVTGKGIEILRAGGVEVVVPFLEEECCAVAKVFLTNQSQHRPYITLKWAESADGFLDKQRDNDHEPPVVLSSPYTQMLVHRERSASSAILVGQRTYDLDHPTLTNRRWVSSPYSPRPILLSSSRPATLPEHWLHLATLSQEELRRLMVDHGLTSLMVEGGAMTHRQFIELGLWDEIRREVAPVRLGEGVTAPSRPETALLSSSIMLDGRRVERWTRSF